MVTIRKVVDSRWPVAGDVLYAQLTELLAICHVEIDGDPRDGDTVILTTRDKRGGIVRYYTDRLDRAVSLALADH